MHHLSIFNELLAKEKQRAQLEIILRWLAIRFLFFTDEKIYLSPSFDENKNVMTPRPHGNWIWTLWRSNRFVIARKLSKITRNSEVICGRHFPTRGLIFVSWNRFRITHLYSSCCVMFYLLCFSPLNRVNYVKIIRYRIQTYPPRQRTHNRRKTHFAKVLVT